MGKFIANYPKKLIIGEVYPLKLTNNTLIQLKRIKGLKITFNYCIIYGS